MTTSKKILIIIPLVIFTFLSIFVPAKYSSYRNNFISQYEIQPEAITDAISTTVYQQPVTFDPDSILGQIVNPFYEVDTQNKVDEIAEVDVDIEYMVVDASVPQPLSFFEWVGSNISAFFKGLVICIGLYLLLIVIALFFSLIGTEGLIFTAACDWLGRH